MKKSRRTSAKSILYLAVIGLIAGVLIWNIAMLFTLVMAVATYMDDLFVYSKTEVERLRINFDIMPEDQYRSYNEYMEWMKGSPVYRIYKQKYGSKINRYADRKGDPVKPLSEPKR